MAPGPNSSTHPLTDHFAWLERLARQLASDPDQADELVQDTWLAALRGRRDDLVAPRAFLRKILERALFQRRRTDRRRTDHESLVEAGSPSPATDDVLERAELGQELTREVLALGEPYRTAILLRYANGLSPSAIAERLALPHATVRSHLARGRAILRERWRRRHPGDERAWLASLALLAPRPDATLTTSVSSALTGAALVNAKWIVTTLAAVACAALLWTFGQPTDHAENRATGAVTRPEGRLTEIGHAPDDLPPTSREESTARVAGVLAETPEEPIAAPVTEVATQSIRGRVVDPTSRPVAGIEVTFEASGDVLASAASDPMGRFELVAPVVPGRIQVADPEVVNLFVFQARARLDEEVWLVVAPHRPLEGTVVDEQDRPVAGARVELSFPDGFRGRFDAVFDAADDQRPVTTSDENGRFSLVRVPVVDDSAIRAHLDGFEPADVEAPTHADSNLRLVLQPLEATAHMLRGRVLDVRDLPVPGALVSLGRKSATSGPDGTFELDREDALEATVLVAVKPGHLPGRRVASSDPATGQPRFPDFIELRLGGAPLELAGQVVDERGAPLPEIGVWIADPTGFGTIGDDLFAQVEFLAAPTDSTYDPESDAYFRTVTTDADGRFLIQGLDDREYTLALFERSTLRLEEAGPFTAGRTDLRIEVSPRATGRVTGMVRSGSGTPVAGVRVALSAQVFGGVHSSNGRMVTAADGRFEFTGVAADEVVLSVRGDGVVPLWQTVQRTEEDVELIVDLLCHFKVDASGSYPNATGVGVRDADGNTVEVHRIGASGYTRSSRWGLAEGRSETLAVSQTATTLVIFDGSDELRTIDLRLTPGQLTVVTP